jgi:hypothetical protein
MQAPQQENDNESACRTARVLWHLGCGPEDPVHHPGLGTDGLVVGLWGPAQAGQSAVDPELFFRRVDRERRDAWGVHHRQDDDDEMYALPHTLLPPSLLGRRHRFWPPPLCCTPVHPDSLADTLLLPSAVAAAAAAATTNSTIQVPIDLGVAPDVRVTPDGSGDFGQGRCALCHYRLPMRLWTILRPPLRVTLAPSTDGDDSGRRRRKRSELEQFLAHLQARVLRTAQPLALSVEAIQHACKAAAILQWRYPQRTQTPMPAAVPATHEDDQIEESIKEDEFLRMAVLGAPVYCLQSLNLFPKGDDGGDKECEALVDRICAHLGLPKPCSLWASQSYRHHQEDPSDKRWSRMDMIDIFFPLIDPQGWRRAMEKSVGAMTQRPRMALAAQDLLRLLVSSPSERTTSAGRLQALAEDVLLHCCDGEDDRERMGQEGYVVLETGVRPVGTLLPDTLWTVLLQADVASMQPQREKSVRRRANAEWHRRMVPLFMMPWVLLFGPAGGEPGMRGDAYAACENMRQHLTQLSACPSAGWNIPAAPSVSKTRRTVATHDGQLLSIVMSVVWPETAVQQQQQGRVPSSELADIRGTLQDLSSRLRVVEQHQQQQQQQQYIGQGAGTP